MKNIPYILSSLIACIFTYPLELIADSLSYETRGRNEVVEISVAPGTPKSDKLILWFISEGNVSLPVDVFLEGPGGLRGKLEAGKAGAAPATRAAKRQGFYKIDTLQKIRVRGNGAARAATSTPPPVAQAEELPGGCTQEQYEQYLNFIALNPEFAAFDPSVFCQAAGDPPGDPGDGGNGGGGGGGTTQPSEGYVRTVGFVHKNTCQGGARDRYIVRLTINLSKVRPELLQAGFVMRAALNQRPYQGDMMSSIKDRSDGMFRGKPLSLIHSLGYSSQGERETLLKWNGARIRSKEAIRIHDYVYYRGMVLARAEISRYMSGGKGVFELFNGVNGYSVCFTLQARRQFANGYPEIE